MFKKYYDEKGYLVGISCGEITEEVVETNDINNFDRARALLINKPEKKGYKVHIIDMSSDEVSNFGYEYEEIPKDQLEDDILKEMFQNEILNSITIAARPATKEGFKLIPKFNGTSIYWEFEKEENNSKNPTGGFLDPIPYEDGMEVISGKWYSYEDDVWEAIQDGIPTRFADRDFFDVV